LLTKASNGRQKVRAFIQNFIYIENNLVNDMELPAFLPPLMLALLATIQEKN
jgi:hypothetical protein